MIQREQGNVLVITSLEQARVGRIRDIERHSVILKSC